MLRKNRRFPRAKVEVPLQRQTVEGLARNDGLADRGILGDGWEGLIPWLNRSARRSSTRDRRSASRDRAAGRQM
jgi:hypothetical protein